MSILENKKNIIEDNDTKGYTLPVMVTKEEDGISLKKALLISAIAHPTAVGIAWLVSIILLLTGLSLVLFPPPEPKQNDIEFVLVDGLKEQTPKNKKTKFRSDKNTRTGGINNPKKKVSMPSPSPAKKAAPKKQAAGAKPQPKAAKKPQAQQPAPKPNVQPKKGQEAKPAPPTTRPSMKPASVPKVTTQPKSNFQIPVPPGGTSTSKSYSTGPVGGNGTSTTGGTKTGTGTGHSPSLAPTSGNGRGTGSGYGTSRSGSGYGNPGNPGGGGGAPGIDSYREPDFGPYMRELQRRIRANWDPPKGNESKRVVLLFKIAKDGRLLSCRVMKSSGLPSADTAAMNAVKATAPFRPLPAGYRESSVDIQFTFDYNVFGASYK